jgi:hypothetical protein
VSAPPCKCGRFLANAHATCGFGGEGYSWHAYVADVRGDCKRCGNDTQAMQGTWWWSWDAWKWPAELDAL